MSQVSVRRSVALGVFVVAVFSLVGSGQDAGARELGLFRREVSPARLLAMSQQAVPRPEAVKPADRDGCTSIALGKAVRAFALATDYVATSRDERGDVDYWMKVAADRARFGNAVGASLERLAECLGPSARPLVQGVAKPLQAMSGAGRGDVDYWASRAGSLRRDLERASEQLRSLGDLKEEVSTRDALKCATFMVQTGVTEAGRGDVDYWRRSCLSAADAARGVGCTVRALASTLPSHEKTLIDTCGRQLQEISPAGYGDVSYWMGRTGQVVTAAKGLCRTINEALSRRSPSPPRTTPLAARPKLATRP